MEVGHLLLRRGSCKIAPYIYWNRGLVVPEGDCSTVSKGGIDCTDTVCREFAKWDASHWPGCGRKERSEGLWSWKLGTAAFEGSKRSRQRSEGDKRSCERSTKSEKTSNGRTGRERAKISSSHVFLINYRSIVLPQAVANSYKSLTGWLACFVWFGLKMDRVPSGSCKCNGSQIFIS